MEKEYQQEVKKAEEEQREYLTVEIASERKQPIHFGELFETFFATVAQFKVDFQESKCYLKSVTINLKRIYGLVNFSIYRVIEVVRNKDNENQIDINVVIKAFEKNKDTFNYIELKDFEIKKGDYINFHIDKIINIDEDDLNYRVAHDHNAFCKANIIF